MFINQFAIDDYESYDQFFIFAKEQILNNST